MPVIDLDLDAPSPERPVRWNPRVLILAAAGLLLLSLPGESSDRTSVPFEPLACGESRVILDVVSGEMQQTTIFNADCPGMG